MDEANARERRPITALCCTLSALALESGAVGLGELDLLLGSQLEGCVSVARRFGGQVAGALGDTVVFFFGPGSAQENEAQSAARAALAILAEVRARSESLAAERKLRMEVRMGLHTGLPVAREFKESALAAFGSVLGSTPKLALRLSQLAAANTIVLSGETRRLLLRGFLIEAAGLQVTATGASLETYILREGASASSERPGLLASHHAAAGRKREAIAHAQKAAGLALQRAAYDEAVASAEQAMGWLEALEAERERIDAELALNLILCAALMASNRWRDARLQATAERSHALLARAEGSPYAVPTLWTLMTFYHLGGRERPVALGLSERILELATRGGDLGHQAAAHTAVGNCRWIDGDYTRAREHFERALSLYDPARDRGHAFIYGQDTRIGCASSYTSVLWYLGHLDMAVGLKQAMLAWARELNHPGSTALALLFAMLLDHETRRPEDVRASFQELRTLAEQHGLSTHFAYAGVVNGWASGDPESARQSLATLEAMGCELGLSLYRALVAEAEAASGRPHLALERIRAARQRAEELKERYYLAALHRLEGTFLLACDSGARPEAEVCFRRALELAQAQGARMLELEAALELYKLLREHDPKGEAHALLSRAYAPLTGSLHAVVHLQEVRTLLSPS
jgi:class 3 adenylate cyclase